MRLTRTGLISIIHGTLRDDNLPPHFLALRIARSATVQSTRTTLVTLSRLTTLNIGVSVSSFNANCSDLLCLGHLPTGRLGVSQNFVARLTGYGSSTTVISTVMTLNGALKLEVITRNIRATRRRRVLARLNYSVLRNCLLNGPVDTREVLRDLDTAGALT